MINWQNLRPHNSPWAILLWKEWHEQKWKLLSLTAIVLSVFLILLFDNASMAVTAIVPTMYLYSAFAPLFAAMGIAASEHSLRSIEFVRAQPIELWKIAGVRWVSGALVVIMPLAACVLLFLAVVVIWPQNSIPKGMGNTLHSTVVTIAFTYFGLAAAISLNLYAWIVAICVNQRTEFRAGLIGLISMVVLVFVGLFAAVRVGDGFFGRGYSWVPLFAFGISPLAPLGLASLTPSKLDVTTEILCCQFVVNAGLFLLMIRRYGGAAWLSGWKAKWERRNTASPRELGVPLATPWRALFWMQVRESLPMGTVGFSVVCLTTFVVDSFYYPMGFCAFVGSLLALLIGVGSFVHELEPKLHSFWRSRPISPAAWFWLKFAAGFFVLVALFDLPYFLLAWGQYIYPWSFYRPEFAIPLGSKAPSLIIALFPLLLHLLVYSLAVLAACAIRHSVYSTVIAVCVVLAVLLPGEVHWAGLPQWLSFFHLWSTAHSLVAWRPGLNFAIAALLVTAIALPATLLAAWLIKRDIALNA